MLKRLAIGVLCLAAACASAGNTSDDGKTAKNPDVISAEELAAPEISAGDALQVIQRLRPRFLMVQGQKSSSNPTAGAVKISVDGAPLLAVDNLHNVQASSLKEIRYLSSSEAAQKYGTASNGGPVILLKTK